MLQNGENLKAANGNICVIKPRFEFFLKLGIWGKWDKLLFYSVWERVCTCWATDFCRQNADGTYESGLITLWKRRMEGAPRTKKLSHADGAIHSSAAPFHHNPLASLLKKTFRSYRLIQVCKMKGVHSISFCISVFQILFLQICVVQKSNRG